MIENPIMKLSKEQVKSGKDNIIALDKILKNADALIDSGVMSKEQILQAKETRDIIERSLKAYPSE